MKNSKTNETRECLIFSRQEHSHIMQIQYFQLSEPFLNNLTINFSNLYD